MFTLLNNNSIQIFIVSPDMILVKSESISRSEAINKQDFCCMMSFANSKEILIM